MIVNKHYSDLQ